MLDYGFEIEHYDRQLGLMLARLEELGELDNTVVIVTSDNGMPFPRAKGTQYDSMRITCRWRDVAAGSECAGTPGSGLCFICRHRTDRFGDCRNIPFGGRHVAAAGRESRTAVAE